MIRAAVLLSSYLTGVWVFLVMACIMPGQALALISPQAYSRVVAQAEWIAYQAAQRSATIATVAADAAVASPASVAIRAVAGPVGWAALGVTAGIALYQTFYSQDKINAVVQAGAPQPTWAITNGSGGGWTVGPGGSYAPYQYAKVSTTIAPPCLGDGSPYTYDWMVGPFPENNYPIVGTIRYGTSAGTINGSPIDVYLCHVQSAAGTQSQTGGGTATVQSITNYLTNLPASDPNSIESNSKPLGLGTVPDSGASTVINPVSPAQMPTTVKPTSQVGPTDIVVNPSVPPPANQQQTTPTTQTSTTTTTTTNNPDGSVTQTKSTTASASCTTAAGHDQRTLGTVLQAHQATWNTTGLIGAVTLLKTLTWPSALPVVTVTTTMLGSFSVDFNQWAWVFTALRTLIIAIASLAAYRIIFVGGR